MDITLVISVAVSLVSLLVLTGLSALLISSSRDKLWKARVLGGTRTADSARSQRLRGRIRSRLRQAVEDIGHAVKPKDERVVSQLRSSLVVAGYRSPTAPYLFWGSRVMSAGALPVGVLLFPYVEGVRALPFTQMIVWLLLLALAGLYAPYIWLRMKTKQRQQKLFEAFPDALDLTVVCVEAGLGLDAAINRVGEEINFAHPELSEEFRLITLELRTGLSREEALRNLSRRTNLEEVRGLTALLIQADRYGTSVAKALRVHANSMRKKRQFRAEELAAKLPVKMLLPLMVFIFPNLFLIILGPILIRAFRMLGSTG